MTRDTIESLRLINEDQAYMERSIAEAFLPRGVSISLEKVFPMLWILRDGRKIAPYDPESSDLVHTTRHGSWLSAFMCWAETEYAAALKFEAADAERRANSSRHTDPGLQPG